MKSYQEMLEERKPSIVIGKQRRDGKYPVKINYPGEPNMFGGRYPDKWFNKLFTADKIESYQANLYDITNNSGHTFTLEAYKDGEYYNVTI